LLGLALFVVVARVLGPGAYGDLTASVAYLFIPTIVADAGFSAVVLTKIATSPARTREIMGAALPFRAVVAVAAVASSVAVAQFLPFTDRARFAVTVGAIGAVASIMTLSLVPVFQARLAMHLPVIATLAGRVITVVLTAAVLAAGFGFGAVVLASVFGLFATFVLHAIFVAKLERFELTVDFAFWRAMLRSSFVLGAALTIIQIYFRIDTLLLALLRPAREVGFYGAAYKFVELAVVVAGAAGTSLFPVLARFVATQDARLPGALQKSFDVLLAAAVPFAITGVVLAPDVVRWTAGPEFEDAATALRLLAPSVVATFLQAPFTRVLIALEAYRTLLYITIGILVPNVVANLVVIPMYGFEGAAAVLLVSEMTAVLMVVIAVGCRTSFWPQMRYAPLIAGAAGAMTLLLVLPGLPALAGAALATAGYTAVIVAVPGAVREAARPLLQRLRRRI
jgi:O-antigen/teichoic acid export membrane protein